MRAISRRVWISGVVAAGLWLGSGLLYVLTAGSIYVDRVLRLFVPSPTDARFWSWPVPWSLLCLALAAVTVALTVVVLGVAFGGSRRAPRFAGAWLAVVAAGTLTGLAIDVIGVMNSISVVGWRGAATATVNSALVGAYWGFVQGWIPALIARGRREADAEARVPGGLTWLGAGAVALAAASFIAAGSAGYPAYQQAIIDEQDAIAPWPEESGARPDPAAEGTPPPTVAPTAVPRDPSWCTPEQAMPLLGEQDAGMGHRVLSIRMMNFSDAPCVIEGYPDIAFADQNGNDLGVVVDRGSSYMAQDPGSAPIEVPAQGSAIAYISWDANSTAGALIASTLYAAQVAGDVRGSWPVTLDILEGSTVEVTAWQLDTAGPNTDTGSAG